MTLDIKKLACTDIWELLDPVEVKEALNNPPFLPLPSFLNIRDLGLVEGSPIKPGLVFTSGFLTLASPEDQATLVQKYGVKRIYDLRYDVERVRVPEPQVDGAEMVWVKTELGTASPLEFYATDGGVPAYVAGYRSLLKLHAPAYERVFRDLIKFESGSILYHCNGELKTVLSQVIRRDFNE